MSSIATAVNAPVLEPAAQAFADATAKPPFLFQLPPAEGRKIVDEVQSGAIAQPDVDEEWISIPSPAGEVHVASSNPRVLSAHCPSSSTFTGRAGFLAT